MYLMKSGIFYIFIDEDAEEMSRLTKLKCVPLTGHIMKCGFPENSKEKYLRRLKENGKIVEVIEPTLEEELKKESYQSCSSLQSLKTMDLNTITPLEAMELLSQIQTEILKII